MRSKSVLGVVLAFGVMFSLAAGSGIGATVFGASPGEADSARTLEDIGNESTVDPDSSDGGIAADVTGANEPTVVGVAISGGQFVAQLVGAVTLLPLTLVRLGFPNYFAVPVGAVAQAIAVVGLFQFVSGRELI